MKKIHIIFILIFTSTTLFSQADDYLFRLSSYISEFKKNAYLDDVRSRIQDDVSSLIDQAEIQVRLSIGTPDYEKNLTTKMKISAFYNFLRCLEKGVCEKEEFEYIMGLLNIIPYELDNLSCESATFYDFSLNGYKSVLVLNNHKQQEMPGKDIIRVEYSELIDGKVVSGSYLNVGPNKVRCVNYLSDKHRFYHEIISVRCKTVE